jgi:hypothetical protein
MSESGTLSLRHELAYVMRYAWVRGKDALGMPRVGSDRSFFIAQFVRGLRNGTFGRNIRITASGKTDGAGAQSLAQISAIAFAEAFNLEYVHSPLRTVCHVEGPKEQWAARWENTLNFGQGYSSVDDCGLPVFPLGDFLKERSLWNKDCVVQLIHYQRWTNANTWAYNSIIPVLRRNYRGDVKRLASRQKILAVHIRRGDVSAVRSAKTHYTANQPIADTLRRVITVLRARGHDPLVKIYSQGTLEDFQDFFEFGAEFHLNSPAIWTFNQLVNADILIMARSAFSYVAALLSDGIKLYDSFQESPLSSWIIRDAEGAFSEKIFSAQVERLDLTRLSPEFQESKKSEFEIGNRT